MNNRMRPRRPSTLVLVLGIGGAAIASACGGGNGVDTGGGAGDGGSSGAMSDATTSGSGSGASSGTSSSGGFGSSSGGDAQSSSGSASSGGDAQSGSSSSGGAGGDAQPPPDASSYACDGCAPFPGTDAGECTPSTLAPSTLVYPPDGVLLPPNMNVLEVQWVPPAGAALFEVDFENAVTDVRVETPCIPITSVRSVADVGCGLTLSQAEWNNISSLNAGGDPLSVVVRATPASGTCTSASQQSVHINFAEQNLSGGIYYWQSAPTNAGDGGLQAGAAGGIYYHDFGSFDPTPTPFWTATATGRCVGCHTVSKDGSRMSLMNDDPNADDSYGDVQTLNMDIGSRTVLGGKNVSPGFQTFTHDNPGPAKYMIATTFNGGNDQAFAVWTSDGMTSVKSNALPMNVQGTQPNLSADDKTLVFVSPTFKSIANAGDDHFLGGALWMASFSEATSTISNYQAFLTPTTTQNYYYPDQSPDGNWVVFNENDDTSAANNDGDAFYSRQARVKIMHFPPQAGDKPLDLTALNVANGLSNSWPRWSPVVQSYKGHQIVWVTFSSNRDYGVHLKNTVNGYPQGMPLDGGNSSLSYDNYYPPESPMYDQPQPGMTGGVTFGNYAAPQIWMAAIVVDTDRTLDAQDRSFPAFWLPFQDVTAHNHSAQWVATVQTTPPPVDAGAGDAGGSDSGAPVDSGSGVEAGPTCHELGQSCGSAGGTCCSDVVCCPGNNPSCQYTCAL